MLKPVQINALKRIIKLNTRFPSLQGMFIDDNGSYCFCNSFQLVFFYDCPVSEPIFPIVVGLDAKKALKRYTGETLGDQLFIEIPMVREAAKNGNVYDHGEGYPLFNARFLLDMFKIFPHAKVYVYADDPENKALYFEHETGEGYLLPIRRLR